MNCPHCQFDSPTKRGSYFRTSDKRYIPRFYCPRCCKYFSRMTHHPCFQQNKSYLNQVILELLASCNSMRRTALLLRTNRKTVARKLAFLGHHALELLRQQKHLDPNRGYSEIQFDDMETFVHTKLKPLSIPMIVEAKSRKILAFDVARMPAKGLLAEKSRKKYGPLPDERQACRIKIFQKIQPRLSSDCHIISDSNPHYPGIIRQYLPGVRHTWVEGARGCVTGQGELKNLEFDPLFSFNHTAAMLRANISRLVRKTWNTTKKIESLKHHLSLYLWYHNSYLLRPKMKKQRFRKILPEFALWFGYLA